MSIEIMITNDSITHANPVPKLPTHLFMYIKMETDRIIHTVLYKVAEKTGLLKTTLFRSIFLTGTSKHGPKDLTSREHDEVISNCVPLLGFKCSFVEESIKKSSIRYVIIYQRIENTEEAIKECTKKLKHFALHYHRFEDVFEIYTVYKSIDMK